MGTTSNLTTRIVAAFTAILLLGSTTACRSNSDLALLDEVWALIEERHYDPDLHGLNWADIHDEYRVLVRGSGSHDVSLRYINNMLNKLGDSHCGVGSLAGAARASSPYIFGTGTVGLDIRLIDEQVVIVKVDTGSAAANAAMNPGFTLLAIDGVLVSHIAANATQRPPSTAANNKYHQTEAILWQLYGPPKTNVTIEYLDQNDQHHLVTLQRMRRDGGTALLPGMPPVFIQQVEKRLDGGINYTWFNVFQPDAPARLVQAIDRLDPDDPLIIDLRGNNGGSVNATLELLSHLSHKHFTAFHRIERGSTTVRSVEPGSPGRRGEIVVLVDEMSISAAENFAGIMQHTGLARVVGARTPGQLLWGESFNVGDGMIAVIPTARIVFPDGTETEGHGIDPDLLVSLHRKDLLQGIDTQLQAAIGLLHE